MVRLIVVTRDGSGHDIEGDTSLTVMENIRDAGFDELLALCGDERGRERPPGFDDGSRRQFAPVVPDPPRRSVYLKDIEGVEHQPE